MAENRLKRIMQASLVAIGINIALGIFKALVGLITHSIAITMDAVNNFSDAGSSLITILGTAFASKDPDKKHPFGYGRTEYLSTLLISGLILYAGVVALMESVKKILSPEPVEYSAVAIGILVVAVFAKCFLAMYSMRVGKITGSDALIASGKDAMGDIAVSISTIAAALLYVFAHIAVEAWLGAVIAIIILKSGIEILKETVDKILGTGAEPALVRDIKKAIAAHEQVEGAYDLVLHNYGPDSYVASVHVAVKDTLTVAEFDHLSRELQRDISEKFGIFLGTIGLYATNTKDQEVIRVREEVRELVMEDSNVHQMHGFYLDPEAKMMRFDLVISFDSDDRRRTYSQAVEAVKQRFPGYQLTVGMDCDFNECD